MNQEAHSFDDKEAVTFPAETDVPHAIRITDVCSIIPRSVPEAVRGHLTALSDFTVRCWEGESVQMDTDVLRQNKIFIRNYSKLFNRCHIQQRIGSEFTCWF